MTHDRYELIEPIGAGGMATVWRARDRTLGRPVAIKRLLPHLASDPSAAERFRREARTAATLTHPGIVTVYDTGEDDQGPYIVLELVQGRTVAELLKHEGRFDPPTVASIVRSVAAGLDHAHSLGIVHRDVKPSNLIIDDDGRVRLMDFGIARTVEDRTTATGADLIGTIAYLAPEMVRGESATPLSDVYSLGAVAHEMLTGAPPFRTDNIGALIDAIGSGRSTPLDKVPAGMADVVRKAMSTEPEARPRSAGEFAAELIANTTLPMERTAAPVFPAAGDDRSDEPTLELAAPAGQTAERRRLGWPWLLGGSLIGAALLILAAMAREPSTPGLDTTLPGASVSTSTTISTTTSAPATSTSSSTLESPESTVAAILTALAELRPPEFKPQDVREAEKAVQELVAEFGEGDNEKLAERFDKVFERLDKLSDSPERQELVVMVVRLAELMGLELGDIDDD